MKEPLRRCHSLQPGPYHQATLKRANRKITITSENEISGLFELNLVNEMKFDQKLDDELDELDGIENFTKIPPKKLSRSISHDPYFAPKETSLFSHHFKHQRFPLKPYNILYKITKQKTKNLEKALLILRERNDVIEKKLLIYKSRLRTLGVDVDDHMSLDGFF